jgi:hypothetical protein
MKTCKNCQIEKTLSDFPQRNGKPKGYHCRKCLYQIYKETHLRCRKLYYENNKNICREKAKEHRKNNLEEIKSKKKIYYENNKEEILTKNSQYCKENRDKRNIKARENYKKKTEVNREIKRNYISCRLQTDELFKLQFNLRNLIRNAFRRGFTTKSKKTIEILGCSFEEFKIHLESKFDNKMNWLNQGTYWHMDHIIPISSAKTEEEVYRLNHYTNFQPLYWLDNLKKSNKIKNE